MNKGVTRNFNTQPNEQMHGPLKDSYDLRTNFKQVAAQVSISLFLHCFKFMAYTWIC